MRIWKKAYQYLFDKGYRFRVNVSHDYYHDMSDEEFLKKMFYYKMGYPLDLNSPSTFNEKLQWLKLHDRNPLYTRLVDKYAVKAYVAKKIGKEYIIPTLGIWKDVDEINFDKLPQKFVLKCTHDSHCIIICNDKSKLDIPLVKEKLRKGLKRNYYWVGREWPYKNVPHRIIAEKYMTDEEGVDTFTDYKFFCFNGKVDCVMVCLDRQTNDTKFYFFDSNWKLLKLNKRGKAAPEGFTIPKPSAMDQMFELAAKMAEGMPFVRVDLYQSCGKIYFGEMTFYPTNGFDANILPETDKYWGNLLTLKKEN